MPGFRIWPLRLLAAAGVLVACLIGSGDSPPAAAASKACTKVSNASDLDNIRNDLAGNYCLTRDIDASTIANFVSIGTIDTPFTGVLDGRGFVIRNLTVISTEEAFVWIGMFGSLSPTARVVDLGLIDAHVVGHYVVGILAGNSHGSISHVYTTGEAECTGPTVNCRVAGLVGHHDASGVIEYSHSRASVHCSRAFCMAAGLVNLNLSHASVKQSYATGPIHCETAEEQKGCFASGFVNEHRFGTISDSYATGPATCAAYGCQAAGFAYFTEGVIERSSATGRADCLGDACNAAGFANLHFVDGGITHQNLASGAASCTGGPDLFFGRGCRANGFIGRVFDGQDGPTPEVTQCYSLGRSQCTGSLCAASGFAEFNEFTPAGQVATSYWDKETSEVATSGGGGTGLKTVPFKRKVPSDFSKSDWSTVTLLTYPWLDPRKLSVAEQEAFELDFWAPPLASAGFRNKTFFYYYPVGQHAPDQYEKKPRKTALASKGAIFTMLARTTGDIKNLASLKNVFIDYYWNATTEVTSWRGPVAARVSIFSPAIGPSPVAPNDGNLTPIGFGGGTDVLDRLVAGHAVLLKGTSSIDPGGHWMLATSVVKNAGGTITGVAANDPWTGRQVILSATTWRVAFPTDFETANFVFTATHYFYATIN